MHALIRSTTFAKGKQVTSFSVAYPRFLVAFLLVYKYRSVRTLTDQGHELSGLERLR